MNGRILPFEDHRHREAQRLLPWLVNGRLEDDERAWLEQHVGECSACAGELDALRVLQDACLEADAAEEPSSREASAGWQRMRARLHSARPQRAPPWRVLQRRWMQAPRWLGATIAAQALILALVGVVLWRQPAPAPYRTLGAVPAATSGNLVIVFDPHVRESDMRRMLRASDARIVDGPNDAGAYVLSVPAGRVPMVRAALRAAPGVTLVATLGAGADPVKNDP
jgi:anti-sigma factor RsiW